MRFIHLSDVRLGLHSESGRRWSDERITEISGSFRKTLDEADRDGIDLVLIAGGLFAHRPVTTELDEANRIFASHPDMAFVVIAGESDILRKNSPVRSFRWAPNVHYVLNERPEKVNFPALRTSVYAMSCSEATASAEELLAASESDLTDGSTEYAKIALFVERDPEKASHMRYSGFTYAALGGKASHSALVEGKAYYSGGLEPEGMTDFGEHGYMKGEIVMPGKALKEITFVPASSMSYVPLKVAVSVNTKGADLESLIDGEIRRRGVSNIYRIRITGKKDPEADFSLSSLKEKYRIADITDESEPQYDYETIYEEHPDDMIGYFISTLRRNREELPDIDKKAMFFGIDALLKTAEGKEADR